MLYKGTFIFSLLIILLISSKRFIAQPYVPYSTVFNCQTEFDVDQVVQLLPPEILKKNGVKDITVWQYKNDTILFESSRNEFDSLGRCIRDFTFIIDYKKDWVYDEFNNVIEHFDSTSKRSRSHLVFTNIYNSQDKLSKSLSFYLPDSCEVCNFKNLNTLVTDNCRDTCLFQSIDFFYDSLNQCVKTNKQIYQARNNYYEKIESSYMYNSKGQMIQKNEFDSLKYFYSKNGRLKRCEKLSSNRKEIISYKYDKRGRLVNLNIKRDRYHSERIAFTYNEKELISTWQYYRVNKRQNGKIKAVFKRQLVYTFF
jgi:hypothetical protein